MKILILGSSGLIGTSLKNCLKEHEITEWDIQLSESHDLRISAPDMNEYDFIFFLAYDIGGSKYLQEQSLNFINNNVRIMNNVFNKLINKPFIFASSQMENMKNPYGSLKRLGENYTKILGQMSVRFWNVYGYEEINIKTHVISDLINQQLTFGKINLLTNGEESRQFLHVDDCSEALKFLMLNYDKIIKEKQVIDITNFEWTDIKTLAYMISDNVSLGSKSDTIQTLKNEPDTYILNYWKPKISLKDGINNIKNLMIKNTQQPDTQQQDKQIPIFVIHYKKLTERKTYLEKAFKQEGLTNIHWFDNIDRDTMTEEQLNMYEYNPDKWYKLNAVWKQYSSKPRLLTKPEIACAVSHVLIYKYIIDNNIEKALVFEDDCILYPNFSEKLKRVLSELPSDFDACYLNDAFGWTVENYNNGYLSTLVKNKYSPDKCVYLMKHGKCGDSFLISNKGAKLLYKNFLPFCLPPDWTQTPIYLENDMKVYWTEPALTHQGSEDIYQSSVKRDDTDHTIKLQIEENKIKEEHQELINKIISKTDIEYYKKFDKEYNDTTYSSLEKFSKDRLEEFTERIRTNNNFYLFRFGDGELRNMISTNEENHNCDGCFYYKNLGSDLIKSYIYALMNNMAYINRWHSHTYNIQTELEKDIGNFDPERKFLFFDIMTQKLIPSNHSTNINGVSFKEEQINFFRTIKKSNRKKIYISNSTMVQNVGKLLDVGVGFIVPDKNCYLNKTEILNSMFTFLETNKEFQENAIFLFSCGMAAKVFLYEISIKYPNNTYIDIGSTFDGLVKYSRDFNGTQLYRDVLLKCYS